MTESKRIGDELDRGERRAEEYLLRQQFVSLLEAHWPGHPPGMLNMFTDWREGTAEEVAACIRRDRAIYERRHRRVDAGDERGEFVQEQRARQVKQRRKGRRV